MRDLRAQTRLRQDQAVTDHLTGLANRRRLFDVLDTVFGQAPADRPPLAFLFIDLNGFKRVNDSFGHPVGDEILQRVGARLRQSLRPDDLLARIGGDEFAALLIGVGDREATAVATRLSVDLDEPFVLEAVSAAISASVGVALAPEHACDSEGLMLGADAAMYRAKLERARVALYDQRLDHGGEKLQLADELSDALDNDGLTLHYQAQLDLHTRQVRSVEALVRWPHPEHGLIGPLSFLPLAEQAGLMGKLTRWVLTRAIAECSAWRAAGDRARVAVNISASDLADPELPAFVAALLRRASLPADALLLEVTETAIVEDFARAKRAVSRLRELGVPVSIDDFGAGFTSLAHLSDLAVAQLKLDRRFIIPLAGGARSRASELVRAMIELGHALGLEIVAEGIEDDDTLELLRDFGCETGQGYAIARPVPVAELAFDRRPVPDQSTRRVIVASVAGIGSVGLT